MKCNLDRALFDHSVRMVWPSGTMKRDGSVSTKKEGTYDSGNNKTVTWKMETYSTGYSTEYGGIPAPNAWTLIRSLTDFMRKNRPFSILDKKKVLAVSPCLLSRLSDGTSCVRWFPKARGHNLSKVALHTWLNVFPRVLAVSFSIHTCSGRQNDHSRESSKSDDRCCKCFCQVLESSQ